MTIEVEIMAKLVLVKPDETYIEELRGYRQEWLENDDHSHGDSGLYTQPDIAAWLVNCRLYEKEETKPNPAHVTGEQFMLVREGEKRVLGMIALRPLLGEAGGYISEHGGHIGYGVRPSERRKGYAKTMLTLCLENARKLGLDKVLICCDTDNEGSRKTILACGGQFERLAQTGDEVDERYWIKL